MEYYVEELIFILFLISVTIGAGIFVNLFHYNSNSYTYSFK